MVDVMVAAGQHAAGYRLLRSEGTRCVSLKAIVNPLR